MLAVTFFVLIVASSVSALQVDDISDSLEINNAEITSLRQEINSKLNVIDTKLDNTLTKQEITDLYNAHLIGMTQIMDFYRSSLIVSFIIIGLCLLGLGYSVYFYFKSRGRL